MGNRKQPFGYKMERGEIVPQSQETETVQYIFRQYCNGATFNSLVSELREQGIPYDEGKLWNKNMVARILEDSRYIGDKEYPAIVEQMLFQTAQDKRNAKQTPIQKTEAEKVFRRLSGQTATPELMLRTVNLLNRMIADPTAIQAPAEKPSVNADSEAAAELERTKNCIPIDEDRAKSLILSVAAEQYNNICNSGYETERLQRMFSGIQPLSELDATVLKSTVASIHVRTNKSVSLRLKNGQTID